MSTRLPSDAAVLVTGSSSGFGLLTSVALARAGFRVFPTMRDLARSARLAAALAAEGLEARPVRLDVTDAGSVAAAVAEIEAASGGIDVLVNNAGFGMAGFVEELRLDEYREQFETNVFGVIAVTKAVLAGMRERRRGRIVNISSIAGKVAHPGFSAYAASKFAVEGFSESLRQELLPFDVFVTLIEPGTYKTDIFDRNARFGADALQPESPYAAARSKLTTIVERRLERATADPAEVARAVLAAVQAARPPLRQLVGRDARLASAAKRILPQTVFERIVARVTRPD